eukprot:m.241177 g.241177  ORF g.241177 m.241177 type:complete len:920 (-) comp15320_c0_seq1:369-3128(-)
MLKKLAAVVLIGIIGGPRLARFTREWVNAHFGGDYWGRVAGGLQWRSFHPVPVYTAALLTSLVCRPLFGVSIGTWLSAYMGWAMTEYAPGDREDRRRGRRSVVRMMFVGAIAVGYASIAHFEEKIAVLCWSLVQTWQGLPFNKVLLALLTWPILQMLRRWYSKLVESRAAEAGVTVEEYQEGRYATEHTVKVTLFGDSVTSTSPAQAVVGHFVKWKVFANTVSGHRLDTFCDHRAHLSFELQLNGETLASDVVASYDEATFTVSAIAQQTGTITTRFSMRGKVFYSEDVELKPDVFVASKTVTPTSHFETKTLQQCTISLLGFDQYNNPAPIPHTNISLAVYNAQRDCSPIAFDGMIIVSTDTGATIDCTSMQSGVFFATISVAPSETDPDRQPKNIFIQQAWVSADTISTADDHQRVIMKPSYTYYDAVYYHRGKWCKCWIYLTPNQIQIRTSFLMFLTTKVFVCPITAATRLFLPAPQQFWSERALTVPALSQLEQLLSSSDDMFAIASLSSRGVKAVRCSSRDLIFVLFNRLHGSRFSSHVRFQDKASQFAVSCASHIKGTHQVSVSRGHGWDYIEALYHKFKDMSDSRWQSKWKITYDGEQGLDWGGVSREFLTETIKTLFDADVGLFASLSEQGLIHPVYPATKDAKYYNFAGKMLGKLLLEQHVVQVYSPVMISNALRCAMLDLPISYTCYSSDDPELFNQKVQYILQNDVDDLDMTFTEEELLPNGTVKEVPLCHRGERTAVTNQNKRMYLEHFAEYRLWTRIEDQMKAFVQGVNSILPPDSLSMFDPGELELLISGQSDFRVDDLQENATHSGLTRHRTTLEFLWRALNQFSRDERAKFLQFVTGCSRLPPGGVAALTRPIEIHHADRNGGLPEAHTCFNQLILPRYTTYTELYEKFQLAINEGGVGFGMA